MLHCLRSSCSAQSPHLQSSSPPLQGTSANGTPTSGTQPSPTVNLTHEYRHAVQTNSYSEIWSKIHRENHSYQEIDIEHFEVQEEEQLLEQVLHPSRECIEEALRYSKPSNLVDLVSAYFEHSEHTSRLCLIIQHSVRRARALYNPLHSLLDVLPPDSHSLSHSQCNHAFDVFFQFDRLENPFPQPDSHNFHDMRCCFSKLKQQLDGHLDKARSSVDRRRRFTTGAAICLIGSVVSVTATAICIASHALIALVAVPLLPACVPSSIPRKEVARMAQLDAAAKGTYVLHNDLDTIDRLVIRLHTAVEGDKLLIRLGLERGRDKHSIQEVVKQLRKNHHNFLDQLTDLEEHLCLCFAAINRARSLLLQEIQFHQTYEKK